MHNHGDGSPARPEAMAANVSGKEQCLAATVVSLDLYRAGRRLERAAQNAKWADHHRSEFVRLARAAMNDARRNGRF